MGLICTSPKNAPSNLVDKSFLQYSEKNCQVHDYTGHCFHRSAYTMQSNSGTDLVKRVGWKSSLIAESYIENSVVKKGYGSEKKLLFNYHR